MQDRRNTVRARSFLGGKIIFNNRNSSLDCLVTNLSSEGARIILSETVVVPDEFELAIPQKGRSFRAKLKWRNASEYGVRLLGASAAPRMKADDMAARLRKLEAERAALQARVAQLSSAD
jgi:PilZ domain